MTEPSHIVKEPNTVLRQKAVEVEVKSINTPRVLKFIREMKTVLASTPDGVGLAAPQLGRSLRIFIVSEEVEEIDRAERELSRKKTQPKTKSRDKEGEIYEKREWKYYTFINPVIKNFSKKKLNRTEGCLSVPGKFGNVKRYEKVTIEACDERGQKFRRGYSRFFARVIQHELDHLEGVLFVDKAESIIHDTRNKTHQ